MKQEWIVPFFEKIPNLCIVLAHHIRNFAKN